MTMMADTSLREYANAASQDAERISMSVLVPFYGDNPGGLVRALEDQAAGDVEIVLYDDGEPDRELNAALSLLLASLETPARLLTSTRNRGRSEGRNLLAAKARGDWLVFLDADMRPGGPAFLQTYRALAARGGFDAAYGGHATDWPSERELELHAALTRASEEHGAEERNATGPTAFCSSNILVRADVMRAVPFDTGFTGWGFEDVDWAVMAAREFTLVHVDNPAWHGGLQSPAALLAKFRAGAVNYRRLLDRHPELAGLPGARAARALARIPGQAALRGIWSMITRSPVLPMKLRTTALKLWRASWTAEALS